MKKLKGLVIAAVLAVKRRKPWHLDLAQDTPDESCIRSCTQALGAHVRACKADKACIDAAVAARAIALEAAAFPRIERSAGVSGHAPAYPG